jgi:hypothetical protein
MNISKTIDPTKVNFVCPRCQRIYYQTSFEAFNKSPKAVTADARRYKAHYHSCNRKKGGKRG